MGGLAPDIEVSKIMDTRADILDYVYLWAKNLMEGSPILYNGRVPARYHSTM